MPAIRKAFFCFSMSVLFLLSSLIADEFAQARKDTAQASKGWKSIFDGKTLNGWKPSGEGFFSVKDGAITGKVAREQGGPVQHVDWQAGAMRGEKPRVVS